MRFLLLFDYIYYRLALFYEKKFNNEDRWNAVFIISIMQSFNILTIISAVSVILNIGIELSPFILLVLTTFICVFYNMFRYYKIRNFKDLDILWRSEKQGDKTKTGYFIIVYFLLSVMSLIFAMNIAIS